MSRRGEARILTWPNLLSLARLLCAPLFVWLLFGTDPPERAAAALLLAALGATDWVDGFVARHFNQVSTLGKVLDPAADRILLGVAVVSTMVDGAVPLWLGLVVVGREAVVSIAVLALAALGAKRIDVQWTGKAGTFGLMFAFPLFLAGHAEELAWHRVAATLAWLCAIPGLAFSLYAAATYVPKAREALSERREPSRPSP